MVLNMTKIIIKYCRMKTLLTIFVLFFSSTVVAENISDLQIDGISLGDNLVEKYTMDEILKYQKNYYPKTKFKQSDFFPKNMNSEYDQISIGYKIENKKYIVYDVGGAILFENNIDDCYAKKKEISNSLSELLKDDNWQINIYEDQYGSYDSQYLILDTGEYVVVECYNWNSDTEKDFNWVDNLQVRVSSPEWEAMKISQE